MRGKALSNPLSAGFVTTIWFLEERFLGSKVLGTLVKICLQMIIDALNDLQTQTKPKRLVISTLRYFNAALKQWIFYTLTNACFCVVFSGVFDCSKKAGRNQRSSKSCILSYCSPFLSCLFNFIYLFLIHPRSSCSSYRGLNCCFYAAWSGRAALHRFLRSQTFWCWWGQRLQPAPHTWPPQGQKVRFYDNPAGIATWHA